MNFTLLSSLGFAAGLFALAGGLYLLQRLRVRHRAVEVVTTLFWHEAVHETRARVLVRRFRHPWAYLLILIICALLWSAFAAPERNLQAEQRTVYLLDSSAAMAHGERFSQAQAQLIQELDAVPREQRIVIASGARQETLLAPGEETLLLESRLASLLPTASPGQLERAIECVARASEVPTRILVFGDSPLDPMRLALLPENIEVQRVPDLGTSKAPAQNTGITALGTSLASSGAWDTVDVLVEVASNQAAPSLPSFTLDGEALTAKATRRELEAGRTQYLLSDVPARGGRFEARLSALDSLELDNRAAVLLPNRPRLKVQLSPTLRGSLGNVLASDPAVTLVESGGDLCVRRAGETLGAGLPALVFTPAANQEQSFLIRYVADRDPNLVLAEAVGDLALSQIDATSLADAAQTPISLGAVRGAQREVLVWEELLGDGFDFIDSRAFPMFVAGSLRWLTGADELQAWCAAGETRIDGVLFPVAGDNTTPGGLPVAVSLLSRESTLAQAIAAAGNEESLAGLSGGASDPVTWLLLLAALLLFFEWHQVRTGRMP